MRVERGFGSGDGTGVNVLYLIPYPRFASQHNGVGGHVIHAFSVTRALAKAGFRVRILAEERIDMLAGGDSSPVAGDVAEGAPDNISSRLLGGDSSPVEASQANPSLGIIPLESTSLIQRVRWGRKFVDAVRREIQQYPPEFVYARYSAGFMNWLPALKRACGSVPLVLEVNSFKSQRLPMLKHPEGYFLMSADVLIAVSKVVWQGIHDRWGDALSGKTQVVTNGVDPGRFPNWEAVSERKTGDVVRMGYTGLIESWYDLDLVAEAFLEASRLTDRSMELHFYGDGPYLSELQARFGSYGGWVDGEGGWSGGGRGSLAGGEGSLAGGEGSHEGAESPLRATQQTNLLTRKPKIIFHGAKPYAEMPEIMSGMDLLVNAESPAKAYTSPIKLMEYMASGRPVLSARTPQCEAMLGKNEEHGWLYDLGDRDSFVKAFQRWMDTPHSEQVAKTQAAREYVATNHTWDQRLQDILKCIRASGSRAI